MEKVDFALEIGGAGKEVYGMEQVEAYDSPLGRMVLAGSERGLMGLWFRGQKYFGAGLSQVLKEEALALCEDPGKGCGGKSLPVLEETRRWLSLYFAGREPGFFPVLHLRGTPFQRAVWRLLLEIPYGATTTYGELAVRIGAARGKASMSAQAVGGAVGHNPISILIPCHRVLGKDRSLTGYAGGLEKKKSLLELEKACGWGSSDRFVKSG